MSVQSDILDIMTDENSSLILPQKKKERMYFNGI